MEAIPRVPVGWPELACVLRGTWCCGAADPERIGGVSGVGRAVWAPTLSRQAPAPGRLAHAAVVVVVWRRVAKVRAAAQELRGLRMVFSGGAGPGRIGGLRAARRRAGLNLGPGSRLTGRGHLGPAFEGRGSGRRSSSAAAAQGRAHGSRAGPLARGLGAGADVGARGRGRVASTVDRPLGGRAGPVPDRSGGGAGPPGGGFVPGRSGRPDPRAVFAPPEQSGGSAPGRWGFHRREGPGVYPLGAGSSWPGLRVTGRGGGPGYLRTHYLIGVVPAAGRASGRKSRRCSFKAATCPKVRLGPGGAGLGLGRRGAAPGPPRAHLGPQGR